MDKTKVADMIEHLDRMEEALKVYQKELQAYREVKAEIDTAEAKIDEMVVSVFKGITQ